MPLYDYDCPACGSFTLLRGVGDRDRPAGCPLCRQPAERLVSAPNLSLMSSARRKAHAINEKSRHEPGVRKAHSCGAGCDCGKKGKSGAAGQRDRPGRLQAGRANNRPWMLGH